jgi:hypothetical protein
MKQVFLLSLFISINVLTFSQNDTVPKSVSEPFKKYSL